MGKIGYLELPEYKAQAKLSPAWRKEPGASLLLQLPSIAFLSQEHSYAIFSFRIIKGHLKILGQIIPHLAAAKSKHQTIHFFLKNVDAFHNFLAQLFRVYVQPPFQNMNTMLYA
jgi:hypothetical protein